MSLTRILSWLHDHGHRLGQIILWLTLAVFIIGFCVYVADQFISLPLPDRFIPQSFLATVIPPFSVLLVYELLALVLATSGPFVMFVLRQFEIVSLILLRDLFKKLDTLQTGYQSGALIEIAVVAFGSLLLYAFIEVVERLARHFVSGDLKEELPGNRQKELRQFKDILEIGLVLAFAGIVMYELLGYALGWPGTGLGSGFVELVFGALILYSVALLLLVMIVNSSYEVLFEHSALVFAMVVILAGLETPIFVQVPLILLSSLFVIITLYLHGFARGKRFRSMFSQHKKSNNS